MSSTNLKINKDCNQCGSCLGCGYDFLSAGSNGSIAVIPGTILKIDSPEFKNLQEVCPTKAFEIVTEVDSENALSELIKELKEHKGIPIPTKEDIKFNKDDYYIPIPIASGEYKYDYASDSAAERAALREFERAMYSNVDNIFLKVITEYRIKKIKPYYVATLEEGSVYAKNNQYVSELLKGINNAIGNKLPKDFSFVNVVPDKDVVGMWKMLNRGELIAEDFISTAKQSFDYSSSSYDFKWDTDYTEVYNGTDWRGNPKYTDKYCYKNVRNAFKELAKDILFCCGLADSDIEERAIDKISYLVDLYNKELKELINKKLQQIKQYM